MYAKNKGFHYCLYCRLPEVSKDIREKPMLHPCGYCSDKKVVKDLNGKEVIITVKRFDKIPCEKTLIDMTDKIIVYDECSKDIQRHLVACGYIDYKRDSGKVTI